MSNVIVIKVSRDTAGSTIPFDKLYFFKREDRHLIPKVFGYALVLPVSEELTREINRLRPKSLSRYGQRRDDALLDTVPEIDGRPLDGRSHSTAQIKDWWQDTIYGPEDLADRVVVIPILTSKKRKKLQIKYLSSKKWFDRQVRKPKRSAYSTARNPTPSKVDPTKLRPAISELAYLATPEPAPDDIINPICAICPRALMNLQGQCIPGQLVCYKSIDLNKITDTAAVPVATEAEKEAAE